MLFIARWQIGMLFLCRRNTFSFSEIKTILSVLLTQEHHQLTDDDNNTNADRLRKYKLIKSND